VQGGDQIGISDITSWLEINTPSVTSTICGPHRDINVWQNINSDEHCLAATVFSEQLCYALLQAAQRLKHYSAP